MRQELNLEDMDKVNGGVVYLSKVWMKIGFSTSYETYDLVNCSYAQAFALVDECYELHKNEGNAACDAATKAAFQAKGWIQTN